MAIPVIAEETDFRGSGWITYLVGCQLYWDKTRRYFVCLVIFVPFVEKPLSRRNDRQQMSYVQVCREASNYIETSVLLPRQARRFV
jgi:hypothetical protein